MKKSIIIAICSFSAILVITHSDILMPLVSFLMTGLIPGTSLVVPFWAMMALYCLAITVIVTLYIEDFFSFTQTNRATSAHKTRLPKRRFGNI